MKTIDIHGKDYVQVSERIKHFREQYKDWSIVTSIERITSTEEKTSVIIVAKVIDDKNNVRSTGHAYEKEGAGKINIKNWLENAETSAIGRALGVLGIGIDAGIASAEEMQKQEEYITEDQMREIIDLLAETKSDNTKFMKFMGVQFPDEILAKDYTKAIAALNAKKNAGGKK